MNTIAPLPALVYETTVRDALREDLGRAGDLTSDAIVPGERMVDARIVTRQIGHVAGGDLAISVFRELDPSVETRLLVRDGERVEAGEGLLQLRGSARSILSAERTALNFFGHLCGIATLTSAYVLAAEGSGAGVVCTRKTTPGLRALEKYAVRCGGGSNHRFGLDDAVLIKDNHLAVAGGVRAAVGLARARVGHMIRIELEVDTLEQLRDGLEVGIDAVLLDNMDVETLCRAVAMVAGRCVTEASGGINLETVAAVAATGVDLLSVGALTHSAPWLDLSLEIEAD